MPNYSLEKIIRTLFLFQGSYYSLMAKRVGFAPRHCFSSLVFARLFLYFFHSYYFFVAITPGLQTTVSSVVWSACFCCIWHRLQADFQPVRIPHKQKKRNTNSKCSYFSLLAESLKVNLNFLSSGNPLLWRFIFNLFANFRNFCICFSKLRETVNITKLKIKACYIMVTTTNFIE